MYNIHSSTESYFFTYDQTNAKKGADDLVSMHYHFCKIILPTELRHLDIFCDCCYGQNKKYTLFRSLHHLVHDLDRFDTIQVMFDRSLFKHWSKYILTTPYKIKLLFRPDALFRFSLKNHIHSQYNTGILFWDLGIVHYALQEEEDDCWTEQNPRSRGATLCRFPKGNSIT